MSLQTFNILVAKRALLIGLVISCRGWKSILYNTERRAFLGVAPTVQHKRWAGRMVVADLLLRVLPFHLWDTVSTCSAMASLVPFFLPFLPFMPFLSSPTYNSLFYFTFTFISLRHISLRREKEYHSNVLTLIQVLILSYNFICVNFVSYF